MEKESTGIKDLDKLLSGGIPKGSSILLIGPPRIGKTIFSLQFIFEGLKEGGSGIFIVTNDFPENVIKKMESFKLDKIYTKRMKFMDVYSKFSGVEKKLPNVEYIESPSALTEISLKLAKICKQERKSKGIRIVIDSLSTLLLHNRMESLASFLEATLAKIKGLGAMLILTVQEGMHEEKTIRTIESLTDVTMKMTEEYGKKLLEVVGVNVPEALLKFKITDKGIEKTKVEEFFKVEK